MNLLLFIYKLLKSAFQWGNSFVILLTCFQYHIFKAQSPGYFTLNDENDLPSNEVYSMVQDKNGFIWLGCDAGLFKYNGIRFTPYKCAQQKSKSVTGLTISSSGKLYCYNFQGQVFYIENDTLKELNHSYTSIPNICCDLSGKLFLNHSNGIAAYDEIKRQWTNYPVPGSLIGLTKSVRVNKSNEVYFITGEGIGKVSGNKIHIYNSNYFKENVPATFVMECYEDEVWAFSANGNVVCRLKNNETTLLNNSRLAKALLNRKVTNAHALSDGNLWITTYKGIIAYNPKTDSLKIFYPHLSFSHCLIDREGNYWLSTLQSGIIRIPELNYLVWNQNNKQLINDKLVKVETGDNTVFFASINGYVSRLNISDNIITNFHTGSDADIQSLFYDQQDRSLLFFINSYLYKLKGDKVEVKYEKMVPVKAIARINNEFVVASSLGAYIYAEDKRVSPTRLLDVWTRDIELDSLNSILWLATNKGLVNFKRENNLWVKDSVFLKNIQVIDLNLDKESSLLYLITFDGKVYDYNFKTGLRFISALPSSIQAYRIQYYNGKLYVATNKGLWILNQSRAWEFINRSSGLASDNIQDFKITGNHIWLATGKGLQRIPVSNSHAIPLAILNLKRIKTGVDLIQNSSGINLHYGQPLVLVPEASIYSSDGNFTYAYRIKNIDSNWSLLPGNIEQIAIANIPVGNFEIELKVVDHLGRDSQNIIHINGYVKPPFWKSTTFFVLIIIALLAISFIIFNLRIKSIRKKQHLEIQRINLENELRLTRETALKAQMNPHFIFNVLNSIKSYIYKNDKQNAAAYLGNFSDLIRTILEMSSLPSVSLYDELKMIELYIGLEAMMLPEDFSYTIKVDESIDPVHLKIPALIIQPYIENSFKHGLRHRHGVKVLSISVYKANALDLIIEINDNGIGRAASEEINKARSGKHQSFATGAIQHRIELLNKEGKNNISVVIKDMEDEMNNPVGTRVIIKLSVYEH